MNAAPAPVPAAPTDPSAPVGPAPATGAAREVWCTVLDDAPVALAVTPVPRPDGAVLAVAGAEGTLVVLDATGRVRHGALVPAGLLTAVWSPDGTCLAAGGPGGAVLWRPGSAPVPLPVRGWCQSVAWCGPGRLAAADGWGAVVVDPTACGEALWRTPDAPSTVTALAWLRGGRELAVAAYGGVRTYTRSRETPARDLARAGSVLAMAVAPDDRWVVTGNQDDSIHVWRLRDAHELEMRGLPTKVQHVAFGPSGDLLAAASGTHGTVWHFGGRGPAGTSPCVCAAPGPVRAQAWHPDGTRLALADDTGTGVWHVARLRAGHDAPADHVVPARSPAGAVVWMPTSPPVAPRATGPGGTGPHALLVTAGRHGHVTAVALPT